MTWTVFVLTIQIERRQCYLRHRSVTCDLTWLSCFCRNLRLWRLIKPCPCPWGVFLTPHPEMGIGYVPSAEHEVTFLIVSLICSAAAVPVSHASMHPRIHASKQTLMGTTVLRSLDFWPDIYLPPILLNCAGAFWKLTSLELKACQPSKLRSL